jgi:hypothetical protein
VIQVHEAVQPPVSTVLPSQIVEHFIEKADDHFIMNRCICREAAGCQHYPVDLGCLFLGEAVKGIHPELGRRVSKAEALTHLKRAQQAGWCRCRAHHLDTVWMGVGPGDKLMTICNCCECCCLYKMLPTCTDSQLADSKDAGVSVTWAMPAWAAEVRAGGVLRPRHTVGKRPGGDWRGVPRLRALCGGLPDRGDHPPCERVGFCGNFDYPTGTAGQPESLFAGRQGCGEGGRMSKIGVGLGSQQIADLAALTCQTDALSWKLS